MACKSSSHKNQSWQLQDIIPIFCPLYTRHLPTPSMYCIQPLFLCLLLCFLARSSSSSKIKQARTINLSCCQHIGESSLAVLMEYAGVWTPHDKKRMFEPLYHSDDSCLKQETRHTVYLLLHLSMGLV